ncbi:MAG: penicillin-binding protein 2 [Acidobacteria bacterium]|nr:penicillin-binding protein 2 [Acidobacteriota bacterium]
MNPLDSEKPQFSPARIAVIQYLCLAVFLYLVSGFWQLQVQNPNMYAEQAERNRVKALPLLAPRGKILDRDGRILADNHSTFSVILSRASLDESHLPVIADGLGIPLDELKRRLDRSRKLPEYEALVLKQGLTEAEVAFVEANRRELPELEMIRSQRRLYPADGFASHLIGYVGEVSEAELNEPQFAAYEPGAVVGKAGIEREYNDVLTGVDGRRQVVVDSRGREREVLGIKDAKPGRSIRLTIDLDLQAAAELAMEGRKGAVVALDPHSGEVLALVSTPNYDPNKFAGRISAADWKQLISNPDNPLLNRAVQAQLAPGSTFKPFVALAGLESNAIDENFTVHCRGGAVFYGRYFKCWIKTGHGNLSLHKGIEQSCDVYFYNVGNRTGIDKIAEIGEAAGFGRRTGIDLPNEEEGVLPSSKWKLRNLREKWYAGETISVSVGQGALTVTPIQLAAAYAGMLNGGVWYRPRLVSEEDMHSIRLDFRPEEPRRVTLDPGNIDKIKSGLWAVVNAAGTGGRARLSGYDVIGKTGSAQVASVQFTKGKKEMELKDNAWFVGAVPKDNPEIVVAALFEHGEHGYLAGPIVRDVLKAYLDKKIRRLITERQEPHPIKPFETGRLNPAGVSPVPDPAPLLQVNR